MAVSDSGGSRFEVSATPVEASLAVNVDSFLWSAAPGQAFLIDTLTVKNPTAGIETLSDFDDLTSGLADRRHVCHERPQCLATGLLR